MATNWYWLDREQEKGPVSFQELAGMVRDHVLNEDDLVRPKYPQNKHPEKWQTADRVPGLFYMAQRVAVPRPEEVPAELEMPSGIRTEESEESLSSRGMRSLADVAHLSVVRGPDQTETDDVLAADEGEMLPSVDCDPGGDCEEGEPAADGQIAAAIGAATEEWDRRHTPLNLPEKSTRSLSVVMAPVLGSFYRCGAAIGAVVSVMVSLFFWIGTVAGLGALCRGLDRIASRQTLAWWFRGGCSAAFAALTGWGVTSWSHYDTLRYPNPEWIAAGKTVFPFFGPCLPVEYNFILVDVVLVSAVAGYFGARWLESLAAD